MKKRLFLISFIILSIFAPQAFAQSNSFIAPATNSFIAPATNSFISIVNPVRGNDFWDLADQRPETAVLGQISILNKSNLPATWLLRFDALERGEIVSAILNRTSDEKGVFLEITPSWAAEAKVEYRKSESWHSAGSAFLTGYERQEREKLIDAAFEKFKKRFGYYPDSIGAWWVDSYSLGYMQKKYNITAALIVADQYSTDNYQIWGQYFGTPYYPTINNALHPASSLENKLPVVVMQWATRDPVNAYGKGVEESTFSVQPNDYIDYHDLDIRYFSSLVDSYTKQQFNKFAHLVVGLENSYSWSKYSAEYQKQIQTLLDKKNNNQIQVITMSDFALWYKSNFPIVSPEQLIAANDPLGSYKKAVWFMNPYFRVALFINQDGVVIRDIRQYIEGEEELCFKTRCDSVNFATSATRVLDDVSFGHQWVVDQGRISDFIISKVGEDFILNYKNEAGNTREIKFLPRDIGIDGKIFSVDAAILNAIKNDNIFQQNALINEDNSKLSIQSFFLKTVRFIIFLLFASFIPGIILTNKFFDKDIPFLLRLFMSSVVGLIVLTVLFYITSLTKVRFLIFIYLTISLIVFVRFQYYKFIKINWTKNWDRFQWAILLLILGGTIFQSIPTFKNGLDFKYGTGFWGPNTHDGVWHISLVNQLVESVPPENPIFAGAALKNYHYFYDLMIAATSYIINLPVTDLIFRFYPAIFSLMLGWGTYYLMVQLFSHKIGLLRVKIAAIFSLYLIYFAGSFGWIVEYIKEKHLGGESAFWVNQSISFNLNPPYAISLVILITIILIIAFNPPNSFTKIIAIIIFGTLASFKSYTAILALAALAVLGAKEGIGKKDFSYLFITLFSVIISGLLFLSNFQASSKLIIFSPFWFIHSMVDSPDRVGWVRLSLARTSSQVLGQWPKFLLAETISLFIFIFGNLGLRFFSFASLVKTKEIFKDNTLLFIFTLVLFSVMIPILFIQSGNPWNTIQFFYPTLYLSALFSGLVISTLVYKLPKHLAFILTGVFLIIAPINSVVTASGYLSNKPHAFISANQLAALKFLSKLENGTVLIYPYDEKLKTKINEPWPLFVYGSTAYVSAFSKKAVFVEDEPQNQILLTEYKKRIVASKDFFLRPTLEGVKFLYENKIKYIYIPKIFNTRLDENTDKIKNVFENEEVVIYMVE